MHYLTKIVFSLFLLFVSHAYAGSGHDHGHGHSHDQVSQETAEGIAKESVRRLVQKDSIEKSWSTVSVKNAEQKEFGGHKEWVIVFNNEDATNPKERTLYIFLTLEGEYVAANYTGE